MTSDLTKPFLAKADQLNEFYLMNDRISCAAIAPDAVNAIRTIVAMLEKAIEQRDSSIKGIDYYQMANANIEKFNSELKAIAESGK